jgi:hypothetical protein
MREAVKKACFYGVVFLYVCVFVIGFIWAAAVVPARDAVIRLWKAARLYAAALTFVPRRFRGRIKGRGLEKAAKEKV